MNKKKVIPVLILGVIVIVSLIAILLSAKPKENGSLDALAENTEQETQTNNTNQEIESTENAESTEASDTTEPETMSDVSDPDTETTEFTEPEPDAEELARIEEIDKKNEEIFAKNEKTPAVFAYAGIDVSDLMIVPNYKVGGFWYCDEATREQYFVYADCDAETALSCLFTEPIESISDPEEQPGGACDLYYVKTASHEYEVLYDNTCQEIYHIEVDNDYSITIMNEEDSNDYIARFLSDDTESETASGCGCGCGTDNSDTDDSTSSCTTGSACDGTDGSCSK